MPFPPDEDLDAAQQLPRGRRSRFILLSLTLIGSRWAPPRMAVPTARPIGPGVSEVIDEIKTAWLKIDSHKILLPANELSHLEELPEGTMILFRGEQLLVKESMAEVIEKGRLEIR